jgi:hypothetical protein
LWFGELTISSAIGLEKVIWASSYSDKIYWKFEHTESTLDSILVLTHGTRWEMKIFGSLPKSSQATKLFGHLSKLPSYPDLGLWMSCKFISM